LGDDDKDDDGKRRADNNNNKNNKNNKKNKRVEVDLWHAKVLNGTTVVGTNSCPVEAWAGECPTGGFVTRTNALRNVVIRHVAFGVDSIDSTHPRFARRVISRFDLDPLRVAIHISTGNVVATRGALWCALHGALMVPRELDMIQHHVARVDDLDCEPEETTRVVGATAGQSGGLLSPAELTKYMPAIHVAYAVSRPRSALRALRTLGRAKNLPVDVLECIAQLRPRRVQHRLCLRKYLQIACAAEFERGARSNLILRFWAHRCKQARGLLSGRPSSIALCRAFVHTLVRTFQSGASTEQRGARLADEMMHVINAWRWHAASAPHSIQQFEAIDDIPTWGLSLENTILQRRPGFGSRPRVSIDGVVAPHLNIISSRLVRGLIKLERVHGYCLHRSACLAFSHEDREREEVERSE
jgi:hypothetical protein